MEESEHKALRILSLDGGGVRGYSELIILEEIMRRVQKLQKLQNLPNPATYFDLIGGTSTGGLIAIMLGRLRMSLEECIGAYEELCSDLFGKKEGRLKRLLGQSKYSGDKFTEILRSVIGKKLQDPDAKLYEPGQPCKVFVCTISTSNVQNIRLLRSYEPGSHADHQWAIWEAARAAAAAATYYPAIEVGPETCREKFVDAGLGCNNPTLEVHREAMRVFGPTREVACILSLGTGLRNIAHIKAPTTLVDKILPRNIVKALQKLALDSENVASMLEEKYGELEGLYYRFSVDHGLEGVKLDHHQQLGEIKSQTLAYIKKGKVSKQLDYVAASLAGITPARYNIGILSTSVKDIAAATERPPVPQEADNSFILNRRWSFAEGAQTLSHQHQKDNLTKRYQDARSGYRSCTWFLEREDFRRFRDPLQYLILWVKGMSGCGKSVLASAVINELATAPADGVNSHTLFCFCQSEPERTTYGDLLRVLLSQTMEWQRPEMLLKVKRFLAGLSSPKADSGGDGEEADGELLRLVVEAIRALGKVYIVIDGLDYCSANHHTISNMINTILRGTAKRKPSILLTSQSDGADVLHRLEDDFRDYGVRFEITKEDTAQDLKALIEHRVKNQKSPLCGLPTELQQEVVSGIYARAGGMFLYTTLLLNELTSDTITILSPKAVRSALRKLPKTLIQMYHSQLATAAQSLQGREICCWIFASMRPLTWNEIRNALAICGGLYDPEDLISDTPSCESVIRRVCGPLVETFGEKPFLRFISSTVKEYLGQDSDLGVSIGIPTAHSAVVSKLLVMLQLPGAPDLSQQDPQHAETAIREYSETPGRWLYPYAVLNWYKHLKLCVEETPVDTCLEDAVVEFLQSSQSLNWLVTVFVMAKSDEGGQISSTAFANDFIDCLSTWLNGGDFADQSQTKRYVERWSRDFLSLMIDWGKAIERDPSHIYSIHLNLLPEGHTFRHFLEDRSYVSVIKLNSRTPFTRSCQKAPWFRHVFAVDSKEKLAFTFQSNYLRCFLISTGLLVAERSFGSPQARFVKAKLCPNDRYIAILLEEIPSVDDVTLQSITHIRHGLQLTTLNTRQFSIAWCLENDQDRDETQDIAEELKFPESRYSVYVVQLSYYERPSAKVFSTLPGKSKSLVTSYTRPIFWEIDEPHVLEFSPDDLKLATANGTILLEDGLVLPLKEPESRSRRGTKITGDFQKTVYLKNRKCIELYDAQIHRTTEVPLSGIGHVLAISDRGRFILLLTVQTPRRSSYSNGASNIVPQQGTISIYDFKERRTTELLTLEPPESKRHAPWKLHEGPFPACFGPESSKRHCVLLYSPHEWNLAQNIQCAKGYDDVGSIAKSPHILIFDCGPRPGSGFGSNPVLRYAVSVTELARECGFEGMIEKKHGTISPSQALLCSNLLTWSEDGFQTTTLSENGKMILVKIHDLHKAISRFPRNLEQPSQSSYWESLFISHLLISPGRNTLYYLRVVPHHNLRGDARVEPAQHSPHCKLTIVAVRRTDRKPLEWSSSSFSFKSLRSSDIRQYASISDTNRIMLGRLEIKLSFEQGNLSATFAEENTIAERAHRAFKKLVRGQPFRQQAETTTSVSNGLAPPTNLSHPDTSNEEKFVDFLANSSAILGVYRVLRKLLEGNTVEDQLKRIREDEEFMMVGSQTCQASLHLFQYARLDNTGKVMEGRRREPRSFEICLCIFDERVDCITWMVHTYTAGDSRKSEMSFPETAWALHPTKPLLAWLLPGHKLRISSTDVERSPICLSEPLTLEVEPSQALRFSRSGRYLLVQARETLKAAFLEDVVGPSERNVIVFDLVRGSMIKLVLSSPESLSIDIDDEFLRTYRLTREDVIEMNIYKLPELVEMERFNLTSLPADYHCGSCGMTFQEKCDILAVDCGNAITLALSHGYTGHEKAHLLNKACEPLLIRIGNPTLSVDLEVTDTLVMERDEMRTPSVLDSDGNVVEYIPLPLNPLQSPQFNSHKTAADEQIGIAARSSPEPGNNKLSNEQPTSGVARVEGGIVNDKPTDDGTAERSSKHGHHPDQSTTQVLAVSGNLDKIITESKLADLSFGICTAIFEAQSGLRLSCHPKKDIGESIFECMKAAAEALGMEMPIQSWDEFLNVMSANDDSNFFILDKIFSEDSAADGCQIPQILHTFKFNPTPAPLDGNRATQNPKLEWSSALDIGWIEQDTVWEFSQVFHGSGKRIRFPYYFSRMSGMWQKFMRKRLQSDKRLQNRFDSIKEQMEGFETEKADDTADRLREMMPDSSQFANLKDEILAGMCDRVLRSYLQQSLEVQLDEPISGS